MSKEKGGNNSPFKKPRNFVNNTMDNDVITSKVNITFPNLHFYFQIIYFYNNCYYGYYEVLQILF